MDQKIEDYILKHSDAEDPVLNELQRETYAKMLHPRMISGHLQGQLLTAISKMIQPQVVVEIGTFTGYASICLAKGLKEGGMVHTIEINDELESFAKTYFEKANASSKIKQYIGDAREIIDRLPEPFDLVFIDADKEQYLEYYQAVLPKLVSGGVILADNVLWSGKVVEEVQENDKFTKGIVDFNSFVKNDDRVEKFIIPLRDGLMFIRKI